jgi:hypothetical protein
MRRRVIIVGAALAALTVVGQTAGHAHGNPVPKDVPPACVEQQLPGGLHLQVGYCP